MAYIGLKSSGHSGTQFKHKKVFTNTDKFLNSQPSFEDVKIESPENRGHLTVSHIFKTTFVYLLFIILSIIISAFIYKIDTMLVENKKYNTIQYNMHLNKLKLSEENFKTKLFEQAKKEYESGNYLHAHEKLYAILLTDENNKAAESMLINVLNAKCQNNKFYCNQFQEYSEYIKNKYAENRNSASIKRVIQQ